MLQSCCAARSVTLINLTARPMTPADSRLKSDWLGQLQVRRMLMDMMWTTNCARFCRRTHKDIQEEIGHKLTYCMRDYSSRSL